MRLSSATTSATTPRERRPVGKLARLAELQPPVVLAWFVLFHLLGEDGLLARTVDHVDSVALKLTVLSLPLQLVLAMGVLGLRQLGRPRAAGILALASFALMAAHVVVSLSV